MEKIFKIHYDEEKEMQMQKKILQEVEERDLHFRKYHRTSYKKKLKHK